MTLSNQLNGGQAIVDYLIREKVPYAFGLCGVISRLEILRRAWVLTSASLAPRSMAPNKRPPLLAHTEMTVPKGSASGLIAAAAENVVRLARDRVHL